MRISWLALFLSFLAISYPDCQAIDLGSVHAAEGLNPRVSIELGSKTVAPQDPKTLPPDLKGGWYAAGEYVIEKTVFEIPELGFAWSADRNYLKKIGPMADTENRPLGLYVTEDQKLIFLALMKENLELKLLCFHRKKDQAWELIREEEVFTNAIPYVKSFQFLSPKLAPGFAGNSPGSTAIAIATIYDSNAFSEKKVAWLLTLDSFKSLPAQDVLKLGPVLDQILRK